MGSGSVHTCRQSSHVASLVVDAFRCEADLHLHRRARTRVMRRMRAHGAGDADDGEDREEEVPQRPELAKHVHPRLTEFLGEDSWHLPSTRHDNLCLSIDDRPDQSERREVQRDRRT